MKNFNYKDHIAKIRKEHNISRSKNIAFAVFQIGNDCGELIGSSGQVTRPGMVEVPKQPFFETFDVRDGYPRPYDSEYKLLGELASRYGQMPNIEGMVNLYTERPPCASCSFVIKQFRLRFPNIMLMVNQEG